MPKGNLRSIHGGKGQPPAPPKRNTPEQIEIQCNNRSLSDVAGDLRRTIKEKNEDQPRFFVRGSYPIFLDREFSPRALTEEIAGEPFSEGVLWSETNAEGGKRQVFPPLRVLGSVLGNPGTEFLPLVSVLRTPFTARDENGKIEFVTEKGYHAGTGIYLADNAGIDALPKPEQITRELMQSALEYLFTEVLEGFPFASEIDKVNALSLFILPYVKPLIAGATPLHLVEAPTQRTGKSLLIESAMIAYLGDLPSSVEYPDQGLKGGNQSEEFRKRIVTALLEGWLVILFENVNGVLDSGALAKYLTQKKHKDRLMSTMSSLNLTNDSIWIANGNNPRVSAEIAARTLRIRLDARSENPETRKNFKRPGVDLQRAFIRENRTEILQACFTLILWWTKEGCPLPPEGSRAFGGFDEYMRVVGGIIGACGLKGFGEQGDGYEIRDPLIDEWIQFFSAWGDLREPSGAPHPFACSGGSGGTKGTGTPLSAKKILDLCQKVEYKKFTGSAVGGRGVSSGWVYDSATLSAGDDSLLTFTRGDGNAKSQESRLGRALLKTVGKVYGGYKLESIINPHTKTNEYFLTAVSVFSSVVASDALPALASDSSGI